ncbi:hypothetical protein T484DRAFT_1775401 [Baffinella frigidus]|nr:hypothetical protein T484DRAFT_1775401 [Cryptophyta sp. CCMP2293]
MVISNPTSDSLMNFLRVAERHTWPNIAHVRSQTQLEQVLDQCVRTLAQEAQHRVADPDHLC